jgi:hypothetical protein
MWPSVVVHEHWPVSQRMIVEMGNYAWSEHIVTVFLACQITIKNVQVQLTVKGKTTPDSYTFIRPVDPSPYANSRTPNDHVTSQIEHGDDVMSTVDVLWVVALAFPDGGGIWLQCVC